MKKSILNEIKRINNLMVENKLLNEQEQYIKKFFDSIDDILEKSDDIDNFKRTIDELKYKNIDDAQVLKNIDEIKDALKKEATKRTSYEKTLLSRADNVAKQLTDEFIKSIRKSLLNDIITSNQSYKALNDYAINFVNTKFIDPKFIDKSIEYWENTFKMNLFNNLEKQTELTNTQINEVVDILFQKWKKSDDYKKVLDYEQSNFINNEINKLLKSDEYKNSSSLDKTSLINNLRKNIKDKYKENYGETSTFNEIDDVFNKTLEEIKTSYEESYIKSMMLTLRGFPGIDELISMINTFSLGKKDALKKYQKQIDDIIVKIEKQELDPKYYKEITDMIKVISSEGKAFKDSANMFFDEFKEKLKKAFPEDDNKSKEIIEKINSFDELGQFFEKSSKYLTTGDKFKESIEIFRDAFGKKIKDESTSILKFNKGAVKRWFNFLLTGSLRSLDEWSQKISQKRRFMYIGKQVQGFNFKSYVDMYFRIWVTTNLIVPIAYNFVTTLLGYLISIPFSETEFGKKYREQGIIDIFWDSYKNDILDTFDVIIKSYNQTFGDVAPQDKNTLLDWTYDFLNAIIPFNSKIDDIWGFLSNSNYYLKKIDDKKDNIKKEIKDTTKNVKEKPKTEEEIKAENNKKVKDKIQEIANKINGYSTTIANYGKSSYTKFDPSVDEKKNLLSKIKYTGEDGTFDENKFIISVCNTSTPPLDGPVEWGKFIKDHCDDPKSLWLKEPQNESILKKGSIINEILKHFMEQDEEKTLKMKDWDEIFTFQKVDDKNPGKFKDVEIKMDVVMDRIPHWRKKYKKECEDLDNCDDDGEDDSFVRAVIDTHPDVVRILFTKGLAHITSSNDQEDLNEGLHKLLGLIREAKNVEVEVWSVYRHPSSPDKIWSLVKGDYKQKELASMDVKMQQSPPNSVEKQKNSLDELKKKESSSIKLLSTDEKKGMDGLPLPLKKKVREIIKKGWTTETPPSELIKFHKEDVMNSVFGDVIKVYKLKPNEEFFNFLKDSELDNSIKRGFCRSIYYVEKEFDLPEDKMSKVNDILGKCENKFEGKYGQNYL